MVHDGRPEVGEDWRPWSRKKASRLDSSHQEEEDDDADQMEPTASSGAACIDGGDRKSVV